MLIPLSPTALNLITDMPRFSGGFSFTTTAGRAPIQNLSLAKRRLDAAIAEQAEAIPPFVVHDFRRVVRSNLGRLKVSTHVAELCLGHKQKGITATYDRYTYLYERRDALMLWEKKLLGIVAPEPEAPGKVVAFSARQA